MRGLYSAVTGMVVENRNMELISNNMANQQTPGYKKERLVRGSFAEALVYAMGTHGRALEARGAITHGAGIAALDTDLSGGPLEETGNRLDLALGGPGYFSVQQQEEILYTRGGSFGVSGDGFLSTVQGDLVLGEQGPVYIGERLADVRVEQNGDLYLGETYIDRLRLRSFPAHAPLEKRGEALLAFPAGEEMAAETVVYQGFLEGANVNLIEEMTQLIKAQRTYQLLRGVIDTYDQLLLRGANEVGTLR